MTVMAEGEVNVVKIEI